MNLVRKSKHLNIHIFTSILWFGKLFKTQITFDKTKVNHMNQFVANIGSDYFYRKNLENRLRTIQNQIKNLQRIQSKLKVQISSEKNLEVAEHCWEIYRRKKMG